MSRGGGNVMGRCAVMWCCSRTANRWLSFDIDKINQNVDPGKEILVSSYKASLYFCIKSNTRRTAFALPDVYLQHFLTMHCPAMSTR